MTFGTKQLKNGSRKGYLIFDSGKKVFLNAQELVDLECKIGFWNATAVEKDYYQRKNNEQPL